MPYVYQRLVKTKANQPGWWDEKKKIETVTTWLATGSRTLTSKMVGVPLETIHSWIKSDWWKDMVHTVRESENTKLSAKLQKVVEKSLDAVMDRVENGDFVFDSRSGEIKRIPAKLRDISRVLNDSVQNKFLLLEKTEEKQVNEIKTTDQKLADLADQFAKFVKKKEHGTIEIEAVAERIPNVDEAERAISGADCGVVRESSSEVSE